MFKWHEVTPLSRFLAIVLFVGVVPAISFYVGMQYQDLRSAQNEMHAYSFPRLEHFSGEALRPYVETATSTE